MTILVTGSAGFIGFHLTKRLLAEGHDVLGIDNMSDYYDVSLKKSRIRVLQAEPGFCFERINLADSASMTQLFQYQKPEVVVNLAAQPGVRYSVERPEAYVESNLVGFANVLECCRHSRVKHLVYASSSSVYGGNTKMPFAVQDNVDHPLNLYAATKKANELLAHSYSHLFGLPTTGLRFFTVYGPWGRPDMAIYLFTKAILEGKPIDVFNQGNMQRDFTYIDDVVEAISRVMAIPPKMNPDWSSSESDPSSSSAPYRIYNVGNHQPEPLLRLIEILEQNLGKNAIKNFLPLQPGDLPATYADCQDLMRDTGFHACTPLEEGVKRFVSWYRSYYGVEEYAK